MITATEALARQLDGVALDYLLTRYSGPGNPMGTQILRAGTTLATKVSFLPWNPLTNTARGIESAEQLGAVLAFYAETEQNCWIEVSPYAPIAATDALIANGFHVERHASTLYAAPLPATRVALDREIAIVEIGAPLVNEFLDALNTGFGTPPEVLADLRTNQAFWPTVKTWHLFLARINGVTAGGAVLSIHDDVAYLAAASTLPAFRNRGIQGALIDARIECARALGCNIVAGQAAWATSSQANMQRAGLQISHLRTLWTNSSAA